MVGKLIKQPNDKYCIVDNAGRIKCYNLTEDDVINMYIIDAKEAVSTAGHYGELIKETYHIKDDNLKDMGFDKTYRELLKFVPRRPLYQKYISCDFATYADCPNCGNLVTDGIGGTDKKCRHCGQVLKW